MKTIAYTSPFVPPEWIAAHGMEPNWIGKKGTGVFLMGKKRLPSPFHPPLGASRGVCPYAGALIDAALSGGQASAVVMTTTCDQMRYAAALVQGHCDLAVFLMNVPSTWQTAAAGELYLEELKRLGRFLVRLCGKAPSDDDLMRVMLEYDSARSAVRAARADLSARQFAEALMEIRGNGGWHVPEEGRARLGPGGFDHAHRCALGVPPRRIIGVPLALVGGPLLEKDYAIFDLVEQAGGCVVLDATEGGERTMPAEFDRRRIQADPLRELARAYFGTIPDAFRRPNTRLYEWLGHELAAREVRGILFRRYLWCDIWHAELHRLREWSSVPVLDIDVGHDDDGAVSRTLGRLEGFLEILSRRHKPCAYYK